MGEDTRIVTKKYRVKTTGGFSDTVFLGTSANYVTVKKPNTAGTYVDLQSYLESLDAVVASGVSWTTF